MSSQSPSFETAKLAQSQSSPTLAQSTSKHTEEETQVHQNQFEAESRSDAMRGLYAALTSSIREQLLPTFDAERGIMLARNFKPEDFSELFKRQHCAPFEHDSVLLGLVKRPFESFTHVPDGFFILLIESLCDAWETFGSNKSEKRQLLIRAYKKIKGRQTPSAILAQHVAPLCRLPGGAQSARDGGIIASLGLLLGIKCCAAMKNDLVQVSHRKMYSAIEGFESAEFQHPLFGPIDEYIATRLDFTEPQVATPGLYAAEIVSRQFLDLLPKRKPFERGERVGKAIAFLKPLIEVLSYNPGDSHGIHTAMTPERVRRVLEPFIPNQILSAERPRLPDLNSTLPQWVKQIAAKYKEPTAKDESFDDTAVITAFVGSALKWLEMNPPKDNVDMRKVELTMTEEATIQSFFAIWSKQRGDDLVKLNKHSKVKKNVIRLSLKPFIHWLVAQKGEGIFWHLCDQRDFLSYSFGWPRPINYSLWESLLANANLESLRARDQTEATNHWHNVANKFLERFDRFADVPRIRKDKATVNGRK